ncbi:hypothetical protein Leryth_009079 [Lithospermum erythrorhizon]|nr:hypothetical protein Leryth_009079 [Lithospermum erythrorhizon]
MSTETRLLSRAYNNANNILALIATKQLHTCNSSLEHETLTGTQINTSRSNTDPPSTPNAAASSQKELPKPFNLFSWNAMLDSW